MNCISDYAQKERNPGLKLRDAHLLHVSFVRTWRCPPITCVLCQNLDMPTYYMGPLSELGDAHLLHVSFVRT